LSIPFLTIFLFNVKRATIFLDSQLSVSTIFFGS
jgi:hypothetical protein